MTAEDEYLDVVDENDTVVGRELRSVLHAAGERNFRVVNAFIKNDKGELWIPRRTAHKTLAPLALDFSVGGHVVSGETYDHAFKRETLEETGLSLDPGMYRLLGNMLPEFDDVKAHMQVYEISANTVPNYNKDDFGKFYWLTPEELLKKIYSGDKAKSDLPKVLRKFYLK